MEFAVNISKFGTVKHLTRMDAARLINDVFNVNRKEKVKKKANDKMVEYGRKRN